VGNALQIKPDRLHLDLERLSAIHGPVFRMTLGPMRVMILSDHQQVQEVLKARPSHFSRPTHLRNIATEMGLPMGVFGAEGAQWQAQRRMVMASFSPQHVRAYLPALQRVATRLRRRWQQAAHEQQPIALHEDLMRFTVDVIAGLAFGAEVNTVEGGEDVIQRHLNAIFPALYRRIVAVLPTWRWFPSAEDRQLQRSLVEVRAAIDTFIAQARQRLHDDPARRVQPPNLLEAMLVAAEASTRAGDGQLSDADVAANVLAMLLAGEDTTAHTLAWLLAMLNAHPAAMARARAEVEQAQATHGAMTLAQLEALPFLDACIHETMRLKPVAPYLPVEVVQDTIVANVLVPAGVQIWCLMRHDSLSDQHFDLAAQFRPERWLDPSAADAVSGKRIAMPFGAGPRICPGRYLAILEMKLLMSMLLSSFEVSDVCKPDGTPVREVMGFVMMSEPLTMRLQVAQTQALPTSVAA
jgi:cytochrome P450